MLLLATLFDYITKFAIYHPHYKEKLEMTKFVYNPYLLYSNKLVSNLTRISVCTTSCLCFGYSLNRLDNLSKTFLFACNAKANITELCLVNKKRKSPRPFLNCFFDALQTSSLFFSLMLLKLRPAIFKYSLMFIYLAMSKCTTISK